MRTINSHIVQGDQAHQLKITVMDIPGAGGAHHRYDITGFDTKNNPAELAPNGYTTSYSRLPIIFQNGPIKERGVNGVTHEAFLAVLIDRLESFQAGDYACEENEQALNHLRDALGWMQKRTLKQIARGVEGTNQK